MLSGILGKSSNELNQAKQGMGEFAKEKLQNFGKRLQELFSLGRPLWGAALNSGAYIKDLLQLAEQKLLGGGITVDNWLENPNFASALAVLSSRISLDVTVVVSHCFATSFRIHEISKTWLSWRVGRPSAFNDFLGTTLMKERNIIINVITLQKLRNYDNNIKDLPHKLVDGLSTFTHFILLTYIPNQTELRTLFIRFPTVICKRYQAGVDLILPVLLDWDESSPISLESMSYFLIQIKNWDQFYDVNWLASATSRLPEESVFKVKIAGKKPNPYISLYLQLGSPILKLRLLHINSLPSSNKRSKKGKRLEAYGEQYCLSALGLDKWNDDNIDVLKQILCAWHDAVNLAI
ncbi:hypothetical protein G9A89_002232 [Geosiphon pyriformis]|nr:hypothetical protein G9A89_002232 [Geosiphon pyriformis]